MAYSFAHRRRGWTAAAALTGGLLLSACGGSTSIDTTAESASAPAATEAPVEAPASTFPQFTAATVDGGQFDFGSLEGQDAVIWFWAPW